MADSYSGTLPSARRLTSGTVTSPGAETHTLDETTDSTPAQA
jgi:hypothetical protein